MRAQIDAARQTVSIHAPPNRKERLRSGVASRLAESVSIHAPPNRKERLGVGLLLAIFSWFQSTPLPTGRSDSIRLYPRDSVTSFNPRPSQPEGATLRSVYCGSTGIGFNPRPSQPEGATTTWPTTCGRSSGFNPRPSQPEGATQVPVHNHVAELVSIHAPPNRKERPVARSVACRGVRVSIHAPPNRKERLSSGWRRCGAGHGFNPRPSQPEGATRRHVLIQQPVVVSIHAPPNRKERPWARATPTTTASSFNPRPSQPEGATVTSLPLARSTMFQSTPLPTGRSDGDGDFCTAPPRSFNPRPSQPEGATCGDLVASVRHRVFQSTPLPTGRSDNSKMPVEVWAP